MDVRVTDTDAKSYRGSTSAKVLEKVTHKKRSTYEKACLEQRRSFMVLVYSVDGMAGKGARAYKKGLLVFSKTSGDGSTFLSPGG